VLMASCARSAKKSRGDWRTVSRVPEGGVSFSRSPGARRSMKTMCIDNCLGAVSVRVIMVTPQYHMLKTCPACRPPAGIWTTRAAQHSASRRNQSKRASWSFTWGTSAEPTPVRRRNATQIT
jgi:hypothetical protein